MLRFESADEDHGLPEKDYTYFHFFKSLQDKLRVAETIVVSRFCFAYRAIKQMKIPNRRENICLLFLFILSIFRILRHEPREEMGGVKGKLLELYINLNEIQKPHLLKQKLLVSQVT